MTGIARYADCHLAMDEALTRCALDVSGRPFLVWDVAFDRDKVGDFDTELFEEFFRAFAMNAGITLHVANLTGATATTSRKPASRRLPDACARRSRSIRGRRTGCRPPRASSAVRRTHERRDERRMTIIRS
jgi:imidazoleglycerol phosphate dehydratase HisB